MVVVLPVPLTPATRITWGLASGSIASVPSTGASRLAIWSASALANLGGCYFLAEALLGEFRRELGRRCRAEVAGDEQLFELFECFVVEPAAGEDGADASPSGCSRFVGGRP